MSDPSFSSRPVKLPREQQDGWESVTEGTRGYTQRLKVPGGWIYRSVVYGEVAMCFVPALAVNPGPAEGTPDAR